MPMPPCVSPACRRHLRGRWRALRALAACVPVALAACQMRGDFRPLSSELPPPPVFAPVPQACQPAPARFALGRHVTAPLMEELRMRAGARVARTVAPGDPPLAEDPQRLLVDIEPAGRIVGLRCG